MFKNKYIKYKKKYLDLKNKKGGSGGIKTLYISFGVPGSGKTKRFERQRQFFQGERCEADEYPQLYEKGFNPKLLGQAHQWCKDLVVTAMSNNVEDIFQSNTNLNPKHMIEYLQMAIQYGYIVKIIFPLDDGLLHYPTNLSIEEQINHVIAVRSGIYPDEKKIPENNMRYMIGLFFDNIGLLKEIKRELDFADTDPNLWILKINEKFP